MFVFPATMAQRRFWLLEQMTPGGNPSLHMPLAFRLLGRLDIPVLERAFNEVVARHETLRTTFQTEEGRLRQIIVPARAMRVPLVNPEDFPAEERARVAEHLQLEEAQTPFDLARGPLLRARLILVKPGEHLLLVTLHHIICDGWSTGVLLDELAALYGAFTQGRPSPLPELALQFADFAQWQQEAITGGGLDAQLDYWRRQLAGPLPSLDLPLDHPRGPARRVRAGAILTREIPADLAAALKTFAQARGATGFMVSLAAFAVLLHRYGGGQEDILVTSPSAGRERAGLEGMIGLFSNPLLLRLDLSGNPTFGELLTRVRATALAAFANADAPFEKLLEEDLQPRRLQVDFLHQRGFTRTARTPGLEWVPARAAVGGALTEWTAGVVEGTGAEATRLFIEYHPGLFDEATVERALAHYETLLAAVCLGGGLDTPIALLPLLDAAEIESARGGGGDRPPSLRASRWRLSAESVRWVEAACEHSGDPLVYGPVRESVALLALDRNLQIAPVGVVGEIYVAGLASNADSPADAFVDDPLRPGSRLFKTGDAGRRLPEGDVEHLGPLDRQLKINGARLEPGWIEGALRTHPQIRDAVVLSRQNDTGGQTLVAYARADGILAANQVAGVCRAFLRARFTEDMVPAVFIRVERFPLTRDGRLDEAALPLPDPKAEAAVAEDGPGAPFLTIHHQLIEIWREVLGVRAIGIRDDFFALGGNSLLAMKMLNRIERDQGKTLLPATLFQEATVAHLAEEIMRLDAGADGQPATTLLTLRESGARAPMFYLHGDLTGGGYYCAKLSRQLGDDRPFYALPPTDVSSYRERMPSIEDMAAGHLAAIRGTRPHGPYVIGGFCLGGLVAYELARQLRAAGETVEHLVIIDADATNPRLARLRRLAEWLGRRRGLNAEGQLYLFCRWHFFLERLDRWKGLGGGAQWEILKRRLAGVGSRLKRLFSRGEQSAVAPVSAEEPPADESGPVAWFDPRWDVPLVFLWAAGGYRASRYDGPMTLLLSSDLADGENGKLAREWRRFAPNVRMQNLTGSHLACITEHVDDLASTLRKVLAIP